MAEVGNDKIKDIKVVAYEGNEGGVYVEGAGSDAVVCGAVIHLWGDGKGVGGPATGAAAKE